MLKKIAVSLIGVFMVGYLLFLTDLDDRIWQLTRNLTTNQETKDRAVWLHDYEVKVAEFIIPEIASNASGITYDGDRNTLWVVVNHPTYAIEIDMDFKFLRRIELVNFEDTESITYVRDGLFLITDERDQTVNVAKIDTDTKQLDKALLPQLSLGFHEQGNKGLEGIAVNSATNVIYTVRERDPRQLFQITGLIEGNNRIGICSPGPIKADSLNMDDLSGLHYDSRSNNLLFLSDESKLLAEVDLNGKTLTRLELEAGFNGLKRSVPQPEGVTMDNKGRLYIVSEPNLLYRYEPKSDS